MEIEGGWRAGRVGLEGRWRGRHSGVGRREQREEIHPEEILAIFSGAKVSNSELDLSLE
jgi:hypothetical protein